MNRALAIPLLLLIGLGCCDGPTLAGPKTVELRGRIDQTSGFFGFSAHQSATGEITGHITSRSRPDYSSPFDIVGRVTCIRVVGRRASIGGDVLRQSSESIPDVSQYDGWSTTSRTIMGVPGYRTRAASTSGFSTRRLQSARPRMWIPRRLTSPMATSSSPTNRARPPRVTLASWGLSPTG